MNEHDDPNELPELSDEGDSSVAEGLWSGLTVADVKSLYAICERASESCETPFKALFDAYDAALGEHQIESRHDGVVFRYLLRVGESTRAANRERRHVDLVEQLKSVLAALGITVVDPDAEGEDDVTSAAGVQRVSPRKTYKSPKRSVSFDDAGMEETWLDEHSQSVNPSPRRQAPYSLLSLPPRRGRGVATERRARSTSSQRSHMLRNPARKFSRHDSPSADDVSVTHDQLNPTLYFESSQTQLEQNAEAFLSTSSLRSARQTLHAWHDNALRIQRTRQHAESLAAAHDREILLKQALNEWRAALETERRKQRHLRHLEHLEEKARRARDLFLLGKSFTHWATSCEHEKLKTSVAQRHVLRVTYFRRWRAIASENQMKIRKILVRKYVAVWRGKTARRMHREEQALAHYEESLMRKCKTKWFWQFCSHRVEGWHEQWLERRTFAELVSATQSRQRQQRQAEEFHHFHLAQRSIRTLTSRHRDRLQADCAARQHFDRQTLISTLSTLHVQVELTPIGKTVEIRVNLNLLRKVLRVWHLHFRLSRQAAEINHKRILQTAWTKWNDALRCKALAQKIDERVVVENLYKWLLQERLRLIRRTLDERLAGRALIWWRGKIEQDRDRLGDAEIVFAERQRRRRLAFGMLRLNITMRHREDAERAAVELVNTRALPKVLDVWKESTYHARRLAKWAADFRFYCLCSSTLKVWREKTTEHKANRRRDAYVQVRAIVKIRLVGRCFMRWRTTGMEVRSMNDEAERRMRERSSRTATRVLDRWQERTSTYLELNTQAVEIDQRKLLDSALSALLMKQGDFAGMDHQAVDFRRETDLALQATALRRIQWATFTVVRKVESADALWLRNRDQHIKQMLRHWATQTTARRAPAMQDPGATGLPDDEPESPSLRPASRAASRSGQADYTLPSSPPAALPQSTPGYMRTPSRSRRAGRFRTLPTPVPFTPMAFNSAYLATTPAPVQPIDTLDQSLYGAGNALAGLTPQVTPFSRKLRAGGFPSAAPAPASALRNSVFGRSVQGGTGKSVRFAGASRFGGGRGDDHVKNS